jgi:outer membrane protein OmpA-like peptidoglycan-associated protein
MRAPLAAASALALLLAGCATVSKDTIVLLPKADGSTGAITASRDGQETLLDSAYATARHRASGTLELGSSDAATVQAEFGAALAGMPPAPSSYTVYFLSGSDEFAPESRAEIDRILEETKRRPAPEVTVIGHTDTVGDEGGNDALSLQRAEKLRDMLVTMGIPAGSIRAVGRGSRELLVPTGPGVDEPRNRRVEVGVR